MIEGISMRGRGRAFAVRRPNASFFVLVFYFAMLPFSDALHRSVLLGSISDLMWGIALLALSLHCAMTRRSRTGPSFEVAAVAIWVVYLLAVFALTGSASWVEGGIASRAVYDVRFLLQPVPVFILLALRGVNKRELNAMLSALVAAVPLSIIVEYRDLGFTSIGQVIAFHARGLGTDYNTYVPFMTFPVFAALYLLTQLKGTAARVSVACALTFTTLFIVANPSRQSMLFLLVGMAAMIYISRNARMGWYALVVAVVIAVAIEGSGLADTVATRFFSAKTLETTRLDRMASGLASFREPWDLVTGRGAAVDLSNGVNPHNNYIYSVMRFGVLGVSLMFLPFVRALLLSVVMFRKHNKEAWFDRHVAALIVVSLLFTLFHSLFGYPHMDPLSGPIVWFGLGLSVVYLREVRGILLLGRQTSAHRPSAAKCSATRRAWSPEDGPVQAERSPHEEFRAFHRVDRDSNIQFRSVP